jgi:hypothetical protein
MDRITSQPRSRSNDVHIQQREVIGRSCGTVYERSEQSWITRSTNSADIASANLMALDLQQN